MDPREPDWRSPALALVNSEWWYGRGPDAVEDQLRSPGWLPRYLADWDLTPERPPTPDDVEALVALRGLLRRLVTTITAGGEIGPDLERLRRHVEAALLRRRVVVDPDGIRVEHVPARRDWEWVLAEIATSFVDLLARGGRERIKVCANPECGWSFFDESKNRGRRWCDMQLCGNVEKVRRFRARRADGAGGRAPVGPTRP